MNAEDLCYTPASELARLIRTKTLSPVELMEAVLARIEALNPKLNAFCTLIPERAMAQARAAEQAVAKGEALGPLHGLPLGVKDMLLTEGVRTMAGSKIHADRVPTESVPIVKRLEAAGAIMVGKTTTPEFGWKALTDSPATGITRNPWNTEVTPGGSSGGAASAMAAGLCPLATGGDGAGSIRVPCSFTGVFGLKPTYGRVPTYPQGTGDMLAHLGPVARTVEDAALVLSVTAGPSDYDRFSAEGPPDDYVGRLHEGIKGLRVAWSKTLGYVDPLDAQVADICAKAAREFESLGCHVEEVPDPGFGEPKAIIDTYWRAHFATELKPYLAKWESQLDPALVACAKEGLSLKATDFIEAQAQRHQYWYRMRPFFERYDLLLTPSVAVLPFQVGRLYPENYPDHPWDWIRWAPYSYPFNLTHIPACTVPAGFSREGLPVGLQIVGRRFADLTVLQAAAAFERARPWAEKRPAL